MDNTTERREAVKEVGIGMRALALATVAAGFTLITLGGVVRVTGSGLGCPDWPLCHGRIVPPLEFHTLVEYSHRLVVSLVSILVLCTAVLAWWRYRSHRWLVVPVTLALALLGVEVGLGGITVLAELPPTVVTLHLAIAEGIFALMVLTLVWSWRLPTESTDNPSSLFSWSLGLALGVFLVLLSGSYVVGSGATSACPSWPLCQGSSWPGATLPWVHMAHRLLAGGVGLMTLWVAALAWRRRASLPGRGSTATLLGTALVVQVLAGAANPWFGFLPAAQAVHLSLATALWGATVLLVALTWPGPARFGKVSPAGPPPVLKRPISPLLRDYVSLTKPRIALLLLVTAFGSMVLAAGGIPPLGSLFSVLAGGALAAGGASALNNWLDRDIDELMHRTRWRPVPSHRISARAAMVFGILLNLLAFAILVLGANLLSAFLAMGGTLFYILVYTKWLKRSTAQNIVIGGAAGAVPPLVGWAAVTGGLSLPAFYLFAIIFFWTPPHFWALALLLREEYAAARVPMLPVVDGEGRTRGFILVYIILLVALTTLPFIAADNLGWVYLGGALVLGGLFLLYAVQLYRKGGRKGALRLYQFSLFYLALLFAFIALDATV